MSPVWFILHQFKNYNKWPTFIHFISGGKCFLFHDILTVIFSTSCLDHTKIIVSLLHDMQLNDQRATLLQLVDKFKSKWKGLGTSPRQNFYDVVTFYWCNFTSFVDRDG
jgi:hypothetical protein